VDVRRPDDVAVRAQRRSGRRVMVTPRTSLCKKRKFCTLEANRVALHAARLFATSLTSRDIHDPVRGGDGVRRREEDQRRSGRDDDEAEEKYPT